MKKPVELKKYRLKKQFYGFPPGCACDINEKEKWFIIKNGDSGMSGPVSKDLMDSLEEMK